MRPAFVSFALAAALSTLAACGDGGGGGDATPDAGPDAASFTLAAPADRAALFTPGPYAVGYRNASLTYRPAGMDADRTLNLEVWYPAAAGTGEATTYSVAGLVAVPREGPHTNADVMTGGPFPVVVYSHGYGGVGLVAFSYGEYFASWGFVLVAPDHTGNTALDQSDPVSVIYLTRPQDLTASLDWITSGADSPVKGRTSADVAAIGHSFGGYTVMSVLGARGDWNAAAAICADDPRTGSCATYSDPEMRAKLDAGFADPRFKVAVAQTPVVLTFAAGQLAALPHPVMFMTARRDQTLPWAIHGQPGWARFDGPDDVWVDFENGGHYSMVAVCDYVSPQLLAIVGLDTINDGCGPDFMPISEIVPVVTAYTHAFIREHALGEARWGSIIAGDAFHAGVDVTTSAP